MTRLSVATLARDADRIVSRVADKGERIVLRKGNKNMAVIVSLQDAARLKSMSEEDRRDAAEREFDALDAESAEVLGNIRGRL